MIRAVLSITLAAPLLAPHLSLAQTYPVKPIRTIVTVAGGVETAVRVLSNKVSESIGQPVVVEAQSAAGGAVGASQVARSTPDGYTIAYATTSAMVMRPFLTKNTPYNTLRDFTPITVLVRNLNCLLYTSPSPRD